MYRSVDGVIGRGGCPFYQGLIKREHYISSIPDQVGGEGGWILPHRHQARVKITLSGSTIPCSVNREILPTLKCIEHGTFQLCSSGIF